VTSSGLSCFDYASEFFDPLSDPIEGSCEGLIVVPVRIRDQEGSPVEEIAEEMGLDCALWPPPTNTSALVAFHCDDEVGPDHIVCPHVVGSVCAQIDSVSQSQPAGTGLSGLSVASFEAGGTDFEAWKASCEQLGREGAAADVSVADYKHPLNRHVELGRPGSGPPPFVDQILPVLEDQQGATHATQPRGSEADDAVTHIFECHRILIGCA
jgi:hypothetical protein